MKILYAIQGTGNGHLSRARDIIPFLSFRGQVDVLISGQQADVELGFPVQYRLKGVSFIFGKRGGIDFYQTWKRNSIFTVMREIRSIPVHEYDLIVNDFEPITAWACIFKHHKNIVGLSHQAAVTGKNAPVPVHKDRIGRLILKCYAPVKKAYGFHFKQYDDTTFLPVIRQDVRDLEVDDQGYYVVYLPSYKETRIIKKLSKVKKANWVVFSKNTKEIIREGNVTVYPIDNRKFLDALANCTGVLCGAGFETPAEALFLGKKLMVIPMKSQYEQHCNAAALLQLGVPIVPALKKKHLSEIKKWVKTDERVCMYYPNQSRMLIDKILGEHIVEQYPVNREVSNVTVPSIS